jgi:hypothetical protein
MLSLRLRSGQAPGEAVGSGRVAHLQYLVRQVVDVLYVRRVGIGILRQPVQRVPSATLRTGSEILDRVAFAVGLREQVADQVVGVVLRQRRWERGLRDPASRVVGELRGMCVRIGDREQVVFGVVGVLRGVARRVGDRGQAVGVVVSAS